MNKIAEFERITSKMLETYEAKNHDYGSSFAELRKKYPVSILIRLTDKLNRLNVLMGGESAKVNDESIEDTLLDIANYAVLELVERAADCAELLEKSGMVCGCQKKQDKTDRPCFYFHEEICTNGGSFYCGDFCPVFENQRSCWDYEASPEN